MIENDLSFHIRVRVGCSSMRMQCGHKDKQAVHSNLVESATSVKAEMPVRFMLSQPWWE